MIRTSRLGAALLLLFLAGAAEAHTRSVSHGFWAIDGSSAEARVVIPLLEVTRLGIGPDTAEGRARAGKALMAALRLHDDRGVCTPAATLPPERRDGDLIHRWRVDCATPPRALESRLFAGSNVTHTHFARLQRAGEAPVSAVLSPRQPRWEWDDSPAAAPGSFTAFFTHGVGHILTGWDHLLFLLVLVVVATSLKEVVVLATGFTLGHSVTLALAVLGIANPAAPAIEAFIALSIVLVALENGASLDARSRRFALGAALGLLGLAALSPVMAPMVIAGLALAGLCYAALAAGPAQGIHLRLALTAAFGLFHGFGFAGELTALELGPALLLPALLGFNLGVEAGQLLMLAAVCAIAGLATRTAPGRTACQQRGRRRRCLLVRAAAVRLSRLSALQRRGPARAARQARSRLARRRKPQRSLPRWRPPPRRSRGCSRSPAGRNRPSRIPALCRAAPYGLPA